MIPIVRFLAAACFPTIVLAFHVPAPPILLQPKPSVSRSALFVTPLASGILGRFRKKRKVEDQPVNPIRVGETIQDADVERLNVSTKGDSKDDDFVEHEPVSIRDVMGTGKAILLGKE